MADKQVPNKYKKILVKRKLLIAPNGCVIDLTDADADDKEKIRESAKEMIKDFADMHR